MNTSSQPGMARKGLKWTLFMLLAVAIAMPAAAQQTKVYRDGRSWVEESSGSLSSARVLRASTEVGSVRVQGGGQETRWVVKKRSYASNEQEARRQFERMRIAAGKKGESAYIQADWVGGHAFRFSTEMYIQVPREMESIRLNSRAGNLTVVGTNASVDADTQAGSVEIEDAQGAIHASTLGGDVRIGNVGGAVNVKSGGGNILLRSTKARADVVTSGGNISLGSVNGASVQTGAGSIEVQHCNGDLMAKTVGGSVDVGEVSGKALIESGGGNIRIGTARSRLIANTIGGNIQLFKLNQGAQAQTGAGTITAEFVGGRGAFADSSLHTTAGDVFVYLAGSVPATIHAASEMASGRGIRSEFPELKITTEGGDFGPKTMYADGVLNGGGPMLKVRTTIGQIEFRRAK